MYSLLSRSERDVFLRQGAKQSNRTNDEILNELEIFPVSLRKCDQSYVDFCGSSKLSMDYWYDGISMLIGKYCCFRTAGLVITYF